MTTLYRPVLIESAEQAEALPEGAFIIDALDLVARREKAGRYAGRWITEEDGCLDDPVMPAQALVPIEAEEETSAVVWAAGSRDYPYSEASMDSDGNVWFGDDLRRVDVTDEFNEWAKRHTRTRLVTPWEDA